MFGTIAIPAVADSTCHTASQGNNRLFDKEPAGWGVVSGNPAPAVELVAPPLWHGTGGIAR